MRKNKFIYAFGAAALLFMNTACQDFFTEKPDSYLDQESALEGPKAINHANMLVLGIYDVLAKQEHYGQYEMAMPTSDDMYFIKGTNSDDSRRDISHYTIRTTNTWIKYMWQYKYQGIDRANATITAIEAMEAFKNESDPDNKTLRGYVSEAKFLRAFLAFDLIKYWGDVPFKTEASDDYQGAYQPRKDRELIYDQIIDDLNYAKENLDWATASSSPERITQGAARALLMRVYLQRAGYSLGVLKNTGKLTIPSDDTRKTYFNAVIKEWEAFQQGGYHNFYDGGYKELFKSFSAGTLNSKESLWEIAFFTVSGDKEDAGTWGTYIGQRVDASSGVSSTEVMGRANAFFQVVPAWYDFYEDQDARRDVAISTTFYYWNKVKKEHTEAPYYKYKMTSGVEDQDANGDLIPTKNPPVVNRANYTPGKWRREWMPIGYKDPNNVDVNYCVLRYADVVLMAAEAYNETGNTGEAWNLLNEVRRRAGATEINSSNYAEFYKAPKVYDLVAEDGSMIIDDSNEAGKFRTALYWERGLELAFEGQRKYDLIRWGILDKMLKVFGKQDTDHNTAKADAYPAYKNFVSGQHELFPIPLEELQINNKITDQNPGYTR